MKTLKTLFFATGISLLAMTAAFGQGLLINETSIITPLPRPIIIYPPHRPIPRPVPVPESTYAIKSLEIDAKINGQIAEVNLSQTFVNTGSRQMEVSFVFPLPYDGAIDSMVLLVDGKEFTAKLLNAKDARKTYEDIVRRNQDPALLEWVGNGMFKTSVFPVPAGASRTITLKYSQLLKVDGGLTDFLFPMSTAKYTSKPIEKVEIHLNIETPDEIKNVYSPTHEINIKRPAPQKATISYEAKDSVPSNDFRLLFDSGKGEVSTRLLSYRPDAKDDGYFMLLASPKIDSEDKTPVAKNVIFALDKSGSMSGKKIEQAREALKFVLNNLKDMDTYNIVSYDHAVNKFKPEIQNVKDTRAEAVAFAESIRASGSTNIDGAITTSLSLVQDRKTPNYIIFLTDGCPTAGEMNEMKLAEIAKKANNYNARIFSFGVGYDVNSRLLDRFARDSRGQSEYVKPDENIEERVSRLYNRISSPVLTNVTFAFNAKGENISYSTNRVYPNDEFDLFAGEQLVLVGRYSKNGAADIRVTGKVGEEGKTFNFDGNFTEKSGDESLAFIARLWAMRRIGEILDQLDLKGQNEELVKELVELSTKYGILTPYTSFLADDGTALTDTRSNTRRSVEMASQLRAESGSLGVEQRAMKNMLKNARLASEESQEMRKQAADTEYAMRSAAPAMSRFSGGMPAGRAGRPRGSAMVHLPEMTDRAAADTDYAARQSNVQQINNRAFFQKKDAKGEEIWVDSTLTELQMKPENVIRVKNFSKDYFDLIAKHGKEITPFLANGGTQMLNVRGQAYRFEP